MCKMYILSINISIYGELNCYTIRIYILAINYCLEFKSGGEYFEC